MSPCLSTLKTRNVLTLKKKVEIIKTAKKKPEFGVRKLADLFECGRTQTSSILKVALQRYNDIHTLKKGSLSFTPMLLVVEFLCLVQSPNCVLSLGHI